MLEDSRSDASSSVQPAVTPAPRGRGRDEENCLVPAVTKLPAHLHQKLQQIARERRRGVSSLIRGLVEAALDGGAEPASEAAKPDRSRTCRITLQLAPEDVRRVEVHAARSGLGTLTAFADLLRLGLEAAEQSEGIPRSRAEDLIEVLHAIESLIARLGPAALGTQVLLAYWVAKASGGKVEEDELLSQSRQVGEDEWARLLDELRLDRREES